VLLKPASHICTSEWANTTHWSFSLAFEFAIVLVYGPDWGAAPREWGCGGFSNNFKRAFSYKLGQGITILVNNFPNFGGQATFDGSLVVVLSHKLSSQLCWVNFLERLFGWEVFEVGS
jgi:hypothetical protein